MSLSYCLGTDVIWSLFASLLFTYLFIYMDNLRRLFSSLCMPFQNHILNILFISWISSCRCLWNTSGESLYYGKKNHYLLQTSVLCLPNRSFVHTRNFIFTLWAPYYLKGWPWTLWNALSKSKHQMDLFNLQDCWHLQGILVGWWGKTWKIPSWLFPTKFQVVTVFTNLVAITVQLTGLCFPTFPVEPLKRFPSLLLLLSYVTIWTTTCVLYKAVQLLGPSASLGHLPQKFAITCFVYSFRILFC